MLENFDLIRDLYKVLWSTLNKKVKFYLVWPQKWEAFLVELCLWPSGSISWRTLQIFLGLPAPKRTYFRQNHSALPKKNCSPPVEKKNSITILKDLNLFLRRAKTETQWNVWLNLFKQFKSNTLSSTGLKKIKFHSN